jgi:hypothetical protein
VTDEIVELGERLSDLEERFNDRSSVLNAVVTFLASGEINPELSWELRERFPHIDGEDRKDKFFAEILVHHFTKSKRRQFPSEEDVFIIAHSQAKCARCSHVGHQHHMPNLGCEELECDCPRFTTAEQSSSYYKSAQSERSSPFQEPQLSDRYQCKFQHGRTVVDQLAHTVSTLVSGPQVKPVLGKGLSFRTLLALSMCEATECQAVRILVARALSNLLPELRNCLPTHMEHYYVPPVPRLLLPENQVNLDPPQPEAQSPDPNNQNSPSSD